MHEPCLHLASIALMHVYSRKLYPDRSIISGSGNRNAESLAQQLGDPGVAQRIRLVAHHFIAPRSLHGPLFTTIQTA